MNSTDRELVERARSGDGAAVAELFSRYWRAARAAAFGVTGELASAEDAAAEGFRQAWAGLGSLRDGDRFGPWLRRIVVRKARLAGKRSVATADTLDELPAVEESPDEMLERANSLAFGLASYAFTKDARTAAKVADTLDSGMVTINHFGIALPETPFGGIKDSGYGHEGGIEGLNAYLQTKFVSHLA